MAIMSTISCINPDSFLVSSVTTLTTVVRSLQVQPTKERVARLNPDLNSLLHWESKISYFNSFITAADIMKYAAGVPPPPHREMHSRPMHLRCEP